MELKDIIKQYKNAELCAKWDNNIPARELSGRGMRLMTDSQDVRWIADSFTFLPGGIAVDTDGEDYQYTDITGAIVTLIYGDYGEVYVTESSRPYSLDAIYHPLDYYLEG
jgi:hypothetical protein